MNLETPHLKKLFLKAIEYHKEKKIDQAIEKYEEIINLDSNNLQSYNNLGLLYKSIGDYKKSIVCFEKAIKIDPFYQNAYNNIGLVFFELGKYLEAIDKFNELIKINPNLFSVYCNLGLCYEKIGNSKEAINVYKIVPDNDENFINAQYNLGLLFFKIKEYKKSAEIFESINFKKSKSYLLKSLYELKDKTNLSKNLDKEIKNKSSNALIGSIVNLSKIKLGIYKKNLFCEKPLNYIKIIDLNKNSNFNDLFVKTSKKILNNKNFIDRPQPLLINGIQSASNIFFNKNKNIEKIKNLINREIENYHKDFSLSEDGLIKYWPKNFLLDGWLVKMNKGGNIKPHIHEHGWLSGSVYINVPPKLKLNDGNLVVSLSDTYDEKKLFETDTNTKVINVETGNLCLFPASLFHYTIPFSSNEDRIVLAFDVVPN